MKCNEIFKLFEEKCGDNCTLICDYKNKKCDIKIRNTKFKCIIRNKTDSDALDLSDSDALDLLLYSHQQHENYTSGDKTNEKINKIHRFQTPYRSNIILFGLG
jgi:hypothetical protein